MSRKEHVYRRGESEEISIGRRERDEPERPQQELVGSSKKQEAKKSDVPVLPPRVSDPELRPDRSNQPREGEMFGSEFLDNLAHQMVAPLQSIEMHASNILKGAVPEDRVNMRLKEIAGHARILAELAGRMRFLHELVSGKIIDNEQIEFKTIVTVWIDGFNNYLPLIQPMGMDFAGDKDAMNRMPTVLASRLAVHQVITNLYDNALKYGAPMSPLRITARREGNLVINEFEHKARAVLTPEAAEQMFTRGYRSAEARAVSGSGTGVGMWISRELMRAMQGELEAFPTNPSGFTRFRITWRVA